MLWAPHVSDVHIGCVCWLATTTASPCGRETRASKHPEKLKVQVSIRRQKRERNMG